MRQFGTRSRTDRSSYDGRMSGDSTSGDTTPIYHVITPGDHFSARTGSAIPTVVDGLAVGARSAGDDVRYPQRVVLQSDTWHPRYPSAVPIAYIGEPAPDRRARMIDAARGRLGLDRRGVKAYFQPVADTLAAQPEGFVLAHNAPIVPWLIRDQAHVPILYAHNDVLRSYSRAESSRILGDVGRIVAVSEALAAQIRRNLPASLHERVRVVINGVDARTFHPGPVTEQARLRVMFLGRAIPEKGADLLLEAANALSRDDLEYVIVGSHGFDPDASFSPYERRLRTLATTLPGSVSFRPFVERVRLPDLLRSADILVIPSRWPDPCPLTVGEGMASGLAVIAARTGGIPELLGDAGVLFEPGSSADLADCIASLADDALRRAELSVAARQRAVDRDWSWAWSCLSDVLGDCATSSR